MRATYLTLFNMKGALKISFLIFFLLIPSVLSFSLHTSRKCLNLEEDQAARLMYCNVAITSTALLVGNMKRSALFLERGIIYSNDLGWRDDAQEDFRTALQYAESGPEITGSRTPTGIKIWTQDLIDRIASEDPRSHAAENWNTVVTLHERTN